MTQSAKWQMIVGIELDKPHWSGETKLDYCRESLDGFDDATKEEAIAEGERRLKDAPKPPHGTIFLKDMERWN